MKKLLLLIFIASQVAMAQGRDAYVARDQATSTSRKVTLQLASGATTTARMVSVFVSCPDAACTVTYTVGSGLATTTAGTTYRLRSRTPATSQVGFYTASNATGGTALPTVPLPAGFAGTLELEDVEILRGEAFSITVASASQAITIYPKWVE